MNHRILLNNTHHKKQAGLQHETLKMLVSVYMTYISFFSANEDNMPLSWGRGSEQL
jgi:hypothetical protein